MPKKVAVQLLKDVFDLNEGKMIYAQASRLRAIGHEPPGTQDLNENGEPVAVPVPDERFIAITVLEVRKLCRACIDRCNAPPEDTMPPSPEDTMPPSPEDATRD